MAVDIIARGMAATAGENDAATQRMIADTYDPDKTYNRDDIIIYNNELLAANEDNVTGEFDATKWRKVTVVSTLDDKYPIAWDIATSQAGYDAIGSEKYSDDKCYFVDDVTAEDIEPVSVFGWHVDPNIKNSYDAVTYLGAAKGMTPASMGETSFNYGSWEDAFFMPKPCMVKYDGTVDYYIDPNDYTKKADGTASDVANVNYAGNAMMEWPKIYWKYEAGTQEGEGYFYCSDKKIDNTYHCWNNYDIDDNEIAHFYTSIYNGYQDNTSGQSITLRSISGVACDALTATNAIDYAAANDTTDKTEWYIDTWTNRMLIYGLLVLMGKSINTRAVYGNGLSDGFQNAQQAYRTGTLNDKGLFWGDTTSSNQAVKVFGMENWWGYMFRRTAGLIKTQSLDIVYKLTLGQADGSTTIGYNQTGEGYLDSGFDVESGGTTEYWISKATYGAWGLIPMPINGGYRNTYYGDVWTADDNSSIEYCLTGGGTYSHFSSPDNGALRIDLSTRPNVSYWGFGATLTLFPLLNKSQGA